MMVTPDVSFDAFLGRVREKFALMKTTSMIKLKTKDEEGDLITMGDVDDWEMAIAAAKRDMIAEWRKAEDEGVAAPSGTDTGMGKMEVWVHDVA